MATIKLETFAPGTPAVQATTFISKLQNAVNNAAAGTVIDCTSYTGRINFRAPINITKSVTLLFGNITLGYTGPSNTNMFNVYAPNVKIKGVRNTGTGNSDLSVTRFLMTTQGAGYHIFVGATAEMAESQNWVSRYGFELHDIELKGIASIIEVDDDEESSVYSRTGAGGLHIIKGSPFSSTEYIDDVVLSNVLVDGTRNHGILMLGARSSTLKNCTVLNAGGHGFVMDSGKSNMIESCRAESCKLAGFYIKEEQYTSLEGCLTKLSGLGYFLRSTKSVTLSSCGAENNIDRGMQPYNYDVTVKVPMTFTIDDVGPLHQYAFDGSSYLVYGQQNYDYCGGDAQTTRYGYTCIEGKQVRQLQVSTSNIGFECAQNGDCPQGFKCVDNLSVADINNTNEWEKIGAKPSGGEIYRGPGFQMHITNGNSGRIELHTGWGDAEELRVYGVLETEDYGYVKFGTRSPRRTGGPAGRRLKSILIPDNNSNCPCAVDADCPAGFKCESKGNYCIPDTESVDVNNDPLWSLLGNKPGINTPVYQHAFLPVQYHEGWTNAEDLFQRMYQRNNNSAFDFTNEATVLNACYSHDPGNRGTSIFYVNGMTTHFKCVNAFYNTEILNPVMKQPFGTKYKIMFMMNTGETWDRWPSYSIEGGHIQTYVYNNAPDFDYLMVSDVLDMTD